MTEQDRAALALRRRLEVNRAARRQAPIFRGMLEAEEDRQFDNFDDPIDRAAHQDFVLALDDIESYDWISED